jgi:hypothetical protein
MQLARLDEPDAMHPILKHLPMLDFICHILPDDSAPPSSLRPCPHHRRDSCGRSSPLRPVDPRFMSESRNLRNLPFVEAASLASPFPDLPRSDNPADHAPQFSLIAFAARLPHGNCSLEMQEKDHGRQMGPE